MSAIPAFGNQQNLDCQQSQRLELPHLSLPIAPTESAKSTEQGFEALFKPRSQQMKIVDTAGVLGFIFACFCSFGIVSTPKALSTQDLLFLFFSSFSFSLSLSLFLFSPYHLAPFNCCAPALSLSLCDPVPPQKTKANLHDILL